MLAGLYIDALAEPEDVSGDCKFSAVLFGGKGEEEPAELFYSEVIISLSVAAVSALKSSSISLILDDLGFLLGVLLE